MTPFPFVQGHHLLCFGTRDSQVERQGWGGGGVGGKSLEFLARAVPPGSLKIVLCHLKTIAFGLVLYTEDS